MRAKRASGKILKIIEKSTNRKRERRRTEEERETAKKNESKYDKRCLLLVDPVLVAAIPSDTQRFGSEINFCCSLPSSSSLLPSWLLLIFTSSSFDRLLAR
eukprot:GHVT01080261.1.p1 GENE.GHVT01080261.1~~GHVT01080261.1.p1  ORF type:complete len:101 (+),score=16.74 GHVT01080261.1:134-436(+)